MYTFTHVLLLDQASNKPCIVLMVLIFKVYIFLISALLVTGGYDYGEGDGDPIHSAEVIHPDGQTCTLPTMTLDRRRHSQTGLEACGGQDDDGRWCSTFSAGQWEKSHQLAEYRDKHVSWSSPNGTVLLGDWWEPGYLSATLLSPYNSTTSPLFSLPYDTT